MNTSFIRKLLAACAFCCMATIAIADEFPVKLTIDTPTNKDGPALLSESGWPLTIKMVVDFPEDESERFPAYAVNPNFTLRGGRGFLIFDDTDGCLFPASNWLPQPTEACGDWPPPLNDVLMEFWPDVDMAGVEDFSGNADRRPKMVDSTGNLGSEAPDSEFRSRGPEFQLWDADHTCVPGTGDVYSYTDLPGGGCIRFGPQTGGETIDGFGFGADDDIPGLVVIAEYGVGLVFNEPDFELSDPIGAVNLAGLVNSVTYDLSVLKTRYTKPKDAKGKPTEPVTTEQARIWAHMNMDYDVLRHLIQYDGCTGNYTPYDPVTHESSFCDGEHKWSIDGGPIETADFDDPTGGEANAFLLENTTYTLKVFLVSGQAPNRLYDEDGDGDVDSVDAELAGYILLSKEDSVSLLLLSSHFCGTGSGVLAWDIDGNGEAYLPPVCPGGPGDLSRPPR